jgi:hypothetical protein
MYSPRWLFLYPGLLMLFSGLVTMLVLLPGPFNFGRVTFDVHTMLIASLLQLLGCQSISFAALAKKYAINQGFLPLDFLFERINQFFRLERILGVGILLIGLGVAGVMLGVGLWGKYDFGELDYSMMMRIVIPSTTAIAIGFQIIFFGFLYGIFNINVDK